MPIHHKRIRLRQFDYSTPGAYFVTVVVLNRKCCLGTVTEGKIILTDFGQFVSDNWKRLGEYYSYVELDEFIIMPNHVHGILHIRDEAVKRLPLGKLVSAFKTLSTRDINRFLRRTGRRGALLCALSAERG
jgi:putative transposase